MIAYWKHFKNKNRTVGSKLKSISARYCFLPRENHPSNCVDRRYRQRLCCWGQDLSLGWWSPYGVPRSQRWTSHKTKPIGAASPTQWRVRYAIVTHYYNKLGTFIIYSKRKVDFTIVLFNVIRLFNELARRSNALTI